MATKLMPQFMEQGPSWDQVAPLFVQIGYFEHHFITLFAQFSEHDFVVQLRGGNVSALVAILVGSLQQPSFSLPLPLQPSRMHPAGSCGGPSGLDKPSEGI